MRILGLATAVLLTMASVCKGATCTYNFTGTAGSDVTGWSKFTSGGQTWSTLNTLKYDGAGHAVLDYNDEAVAGYDHGWYPTDCSGPVTNGEILAKWSLTGVTNFSSGFNCGVFGPNRSTGNGSQHSDVCETLLLSQIRDSNAGLFYYTGDTDCHFDEELQEDVCTCISQSDYVTPTSKSWGLVANNVWYISRLQVEGGATARSRTWLAGTQEPTGWDGEITGSWIGGGKLGITCDPNANTSIAQTLYDWVVITTSGETAINPETTTTSRRVFTVTD